MKITVLKKLDRNQLFEGNPPIDSEEEPVCPVFEEGQTFEVLPNGNMPEGFCTWAWNNIYLQAITSCSTETFPGSKRKESASPAAQMG